MKLPLSLLKSFIDIDLSVAKIEETLTMIGIEVDAIFSAHPPFSNVVVVEVRSTRPHKNAHLLQVAEVFDGTSIFQVVCGAPNCCAGMKTALAKPGAVLIDAEKNTRTIQKTSIREEESSGMLCSATELGIYERLTGEKDGLLEFPPDFLVGADCLTLLWDPVFEISLTPNLGHCMSALGIARELAAALQKKVHCPKATVFEENEKPIAKAIQVSVQNETQIPRYMARIIEHVKVGPSPFWLQRVLLAAGQHPVNNIVDATNYILLKTGQPLHAFDYDKIEGKTISVQVSSKTESFTALTGEELEIPVGTLIISDAKKPIAIAGVMGGANSAITEATQTILLEAASFDPIAIRRASKKMGLRTDSSLRFEKGVDPSSVGDFLAQAAQLIIELSGGTAMKGTIDCKQQAFEPRKIACRAARVNKILGTKISKNEMLDIFHRLQFKVHEEGDIFIVEVPLFRNDILEEIDLVEEVARIYGYNHIERPIPRALTPQIPNDPDYLFETELRRRLIALGLQEFLTCDLISPKLMALAEELSLNKHTLLQTLHSKSEEYSILRPSLLPGLLQVIGSNLDHKNQQFAAFELGRIHFLQDNKPVEFPMVALLLTGEESPHHWDRPSQETDFFDLKGFVENLLLGLRIYRHKFLPSMHPTFHPGRQADLFVDSLRIGSLGELHPVLLNKLNIKQRVYYAELNAHDLQALRGPPATLTPLSQFPSSERDWTLSMDPKTTILPVFDAIRCVVSPLLEKFEVIDVYQAADKTNVTLRFIYRDRSKTVSFEEVEAAHAHLMQEVLAKTSSPR